MRVLVLGGGGNFGARIVRALRVDPQIELIVAGRRVMKVPGAVGVPGVALDIHAADFGERLRAVAPGVVIHCVGPFQGQDYRVAEAALAAGAHYLDLADARSFVLHFAARVQGMAESAGRVAITGASTLPGLSSAVVAALSDGLSSVESIETVIAPGQQAARGAATLAAVFSYLGKPSPVWRNGAWVKTWGWMDLKRVRLDIGRRWAAACDVPDLMLFYKQYPGIQTVRFHAALEFRLQHVVLWKLAGVRRLGLSWPVDRWAVGLDRWAAWFDPFAGKFGGMAVTVVGQRSDGGRVRRTWQLIAPAKDGPEIPCMAATVLARRLARGESIESGARPCLGVLALADFQPEFSKWGITTRVEESEG